MNRLQSEQLRLYLPRPLVHEEANVHASTLIDPADAVRAMVMELARPPSWQMLSRVWLGVQSDLDLPAPGIAVSGVDGLQLWFSIAEPIAAARAHEFLQRLRARFLPDLDIGRLRLMPAPDASALHPERQAQLVPALQDSTGNWSAFLAADLAPIFEDTPWLDIPPSEDGQAALLRGLGVMAQDAFEAAMERLGPILQQPDAPRTGASSRDDLRIHEHTRTAASATDPRLFLLQVMNDDTVALALRIDAAKALLLHSSMQRPQDRD